MTTNIIYAVDEKLYCFWADDIQQSALEFLDSFDPTYFSFIAQQSLAHLNDKTHEMHAAANMRLAFFHGSETLLLLVGALIQAPSCPQAYLGQCSNEKLRNVLSCIDSSTPLKKFNHNLQDISWASIAYEVMRHSGIDNIQVIKTQKLFEDFWSALASKQQNILAISEYNSLKHGFRVGHGGYKVDFSFDMPPSPSSELPKEFSLGDSRFGTSFKCINQVAGNAKTNQSRSAISHHVNWNFEEIALFLQLIDISIRNILTYLKSYNGAEKVLYSIPNLEKFTLPNVASESISLEQHPPNAQITTLASLTEAVERNRIKREANLSNAEQAASKD